MLARSATIIKWVLYALAGLACTVVQAAVLQRFTLWGVIPFLYPLIAALPATFEGPAAGTVYALAAGVLCDLLLPSPIPCFYTLIFPLVGLSARVSSRQGISAPPRHLCRPIFSPGCSTASSSGPPATPHGRRGCLSRCGSCASPCPGVCPWHGCSGRSTAVSTLMIERGIP